MGSAEVAAKDERDAMTDKELRKHFHKICKQRGVRPRHGLAIWDEIRAEMQPDHGPDCRDFGIEDGCPVCDPEETTL